LRSTLFPYTTLFRSEGWVRRVKQREVPMKRRSLARAYSYAWITAGLFVFSIVGHWVFGWFAFVGEQVEHGQAADVGTYLLEMGRDRKSTRLNSSHVK